MKKLLKRVTAVICMLAMVSGVFVTGNLQNVKAEDAAVQKEWDILSEKEQWTDASYIINNCDSTAMGNATVTTETFKEGTGSCSYTGTKNNRAQLNLAAVNLSDYANGLLHLWLYVDDVEKLPNDYVVVALDSSLDRTFGGVTAWRWTIKSSELNSGEWTELFLEVSKAGHQGTSFDWTTVRGIKVLMDADSASEMTTRIDNIYMTGKAFTKKGSYGLNATNDYALYFKADANSEAGVAALEGATVELCQDSQAKIVMSLSDLTEQIWQMGENTVCVDFSSMTRVAGTDDAVFDLSQPITSFCIYNGSNEVIRTDVTFNEIKIVDMTPYVEKYTNAIAGIEPEKTATIPQNYIFAGWYQNEACTQVYTSREAGEAFAKFVNGDVLATKGQYLLEDEEVIISNCDTDTAIGHLVTTGGHKEGTGAIECQLVGTEGSYDSVVMLVNTGKWDLTNYKNGRLHMWLYAEGLEDYADKKIRIQFSDTNSFANYTTFDIPVSRLKNSDWTELEFNLTLSGDWLANAKYFRIRTIGFNLINGAKLIVDDIRMKQALPGLTLNNCDTFVSNDMVMEGIGVYNKATNENNRCQLGNYSGGWNLSTYANGKLHMWLYVEDVSLLQNQGMYVTLDSSETRGFSYSGTTTCSWLIPKTELNNGGWTEVCLDISNPTVKGSEFNLSTIYGIKIHMNSGAASKAFTTMVDDIRAIKQELVLNNCDEKNMGNSVVTTEPGKFIEGNGACINTGNANNRAQQGNYSGGWNLADYADGQLHMWLYVEDVSLLQNQGMYVTLDSSETRGFSYSGTTTCSWLIPKTELNNGGWTEVCLDISNPTVKGSEFNLSTIYGIKIHMNSGAASKEFITIIDDIRAIPADTMRKQADLRFTTTVDTRSYQETGFKIKIGDKDAKYARTTTVYKTIYAQGSTKLVTYKPNVFAAQSQYFNAYELWNIPQSYFDTQFEVQAYWITQDGTEVTGEVKTFTLNEVIDMVEN